MPQGALNLRFIVVLKTTGFGKAIKTFTMVFASAVLCIPAYGSGYAEDIRTTPSLYLAGEHRGRTVKYL
jgi:hypothetical protein